MPYYDEIELGDEIGPVEKVATDDEVSSFCEVWGTPSPNRFTDAETAAKSGMKGGPIVPGIMTMAMMAQLLTDWGGPGSIKDLDLVFRQPVPHNRARLPHRQTQGLVHPPECACYCRFLPT